MTTPNASLDQNRTYANRQQILTLIFALLTLLLALFAIIGGNRLNALALNERAANRAASAANAVEFQAATASLQTLADELKAATQARDDALGEAKRLRQQHATAIKALEAGKVDLARAAQTIAELKTTLPVESPNHEITSIPEPSVPDEEGSASDELTVQDFSETRSAVQ
jgi:hypothetical protein